MYTPYLTSGTGSLELGDSSGDIPLAFDFSTSTASDGGLPPALVPATKMQTRKRSRMAERDATAREALLRQLYFSAFYADCFHEVSPLVNGPACHDALSAMRNSCRSSSHVLRTARSTTARCS